MKTNKIVLLVTRLINICGVLLSVTNTKTDGFFFKEERQGVSLASSVCETECPEVLILRAPS